MLSGSGVMIPFLCRLEDHPPLCIIKAALRVLIWGLRATVIALAMVVASAFLANMYTEHGLDPQ
jgi:hypothetical protein